METTTLQSPQPLFPLKNWVKTAREFSWSMDLSLSVPSGSSAITSARHGPFITPAHVSRKQLRVGRLFTVYKLLSVHALKQHNFYCPICTLVLAIWSL